jgi:hypothetical protein
MRRCSPLPHVQCGSGSAPSLAKKSDRDLGLLHVRVQTWFPLQVQIYLNGHEWLARKLTARGIEHTKIDNVFIRVSDLPRAQRLSDRFAHLEWPQILNRYARQVVPQLDDGLHGCRCPQIRYWVAAQAEYSTDVMFKTSNGLRELYPRLLSHGTLALRCRGGHELPRPQAHRPVRGRGGLGPVQLRLSPRRRLEDQAPRQAELAEDGRQGGARVEDRDRDHNNPEEARALCRSCAKEGSAPSGWRCRPWGPGAWRICCATARSRCRPTPAASMHWLRSMIRQRASRRCSA